MTRFELVTSSLPRKRSTPELHRLFVRAGDGIRTRDPQRGRLMLWPAELLPLLKYSGESRIRTYEGVASRFTVCPR